MFGWYQRSLAKRPALIVSKEWGGGQGRGCSAASYCQLQLLYGIIPITSTKDEPSQIVATRYSLLAKYPIPPLWLVY